MKLSNCCVEKRETSYYWFLASEHRRPQPAWLMTITYRRPRRTAFADYIHWWTEIAADSVLVQSWPWHYQQRYIDMWCEMHRACSYEGRSFRAHHINSQWLLIMFDWLCDWLAQMLGIFVKIGNLYWYLLHNILSGNAATQFSWGGRIYFGDVQWSLHCALSLAAQCIVIGPVCVFVCLFVCGVCGFVGLLPR